MKTPSLSFQFSVIYIIKETTELRDEAAKQQNKEHFPLYKENTMKTEIVWYRRGVLVIQFKLWVLKRSYVRKNKVVINTVIHQYYLAVSLFHQYQFLNPSGIICWQLDLEMFSVSGPVVQPVPTDNKYLGRDSVQLF